MNTINIFFHNNKWCGFESKGHINEIKNNKNYNLICCALSMHLQIITFVLEKYFENIIIEKKKGFLKVIFKENKEFQEYKGIEICFFEGINILKNKYSKYLNVYKKEV